MLLSYNKLTELVRKEVITAPVSAVQGASIDVTLSPIVKVECVDGNFLEMDISEEGILLYPGDCILAATNEIFNLPLNIAAVFKLNSGNARNFLEHLNAGWCDPGWHNSRLTLELKNNRKYGEIKLFAGMKIGQVIFFEVEPVPEEFSYKVKGNYNHQQGPVNAR